MAIASLAPSGDVTATLYFYQAPEDGSKPFNHVDTPPEGLSQRNFDAEEYPVRIQDARGLESSFNLDDDAFQIIRHVPASAEKEFVDDESIKENYYPEVERILLDSIDGSERVFIFDHTIRRSSPEANRAPVTRVHIDQTPTSAAMRVRRHMGDDAEKLLQGRYRIVNVWRPLNKKPVESFPLAFASSSTLEDGDVVPVEHRYANGYTGYTAGIKHNPGQKWYYLSGMTGDERIFLECFDTASLKDGTKVKGGRVAHTAFEDPRSTADAEGRESIEVRALVFGP